MSQQINWTQVQDRAKHMTVAELTFAIADCGEAASAMGPGERVGKDQGYYLDEQSVYRSELAKRPRARLQAAIDRAVATANARV